MHYIDADKLLQRRNIDDIQNFIPPKVSTLQNVSELQEGDHSNLAIVMYYTVYGPENAPHSKNENIYAL